MVTLPLGSSVMAAMKESLRGMPAKSAMALRRLTTTNGAASRSDVCRPPMLTAAETTMGGSGGREFEGVGVPVLEGEAPLVMLDVGVWLGVRVMLALDEVVRVERAVRDCVEEAVTVTVEVSDEL